MSYAVSPYSVSPYAALMGAAPGVAQAGRRQIATLKQLQGYSEAADKNGNINQDTAKKFGLTRASVVEAYAGEFILGYRPEGAGADQKLQQGLGQVYQDLNSADPNAKNAATFGLVAARYKNAGGNYNNGKLKKILEQKAPEFAKGEGVGEKDVQTLGAVYKAIKAGKVQLSDIFDGTDKDAVEDDGKYQKAIDAVKAGDLNTDLKTGKGPGTGPTGDANPGGAPAADAGGAPGAAPGAASPALDASAATNGPMAMIMALMQMLMAILQMYMGGASPFSGALGAAPGFSTRALPATGGPTGATGGTGNTGNSVKTGATGDTGGTGDTGNSVKTGATGDTGGTGDTGNSVKSGKKGGKKGDD